MDMKAENPGLILLFVGLFMVVMLVVGWWASRRVKKTSDYIVAGRGLGMFMATGTMFATWFCAGTVMGGAGNAYLFGNQGVVYDPWGGALCLILIGLLFGRLMRRGRYMTVSDLFHIRYGKTMGLLSVITVAISEIGWLGSQLVAFGTILHVFTGIPLWVGIVISTIVVIAYTYMGGMWAVTITDVIQMIIIVIGCIVMVAYLAPLVGGLKTVFNNDPSGNWMGLNQWSFGYTSAKNADPELANEGFNYYTGYYGWFYMIAAWISLGFGSIVAQDTQQRLLSSKTESVSAWSSTIAGIGYATIGVLPIIAGMIYYRLNPNLSLDDAQNNILVFVAIQYMPSIFTAIFVGALVAALMSSSDSAILAASSLIGYNGVKLAKPDASEEQTLKITRLMVPIVTLVSLALALWLQVIYNLMVIAWTILLVSLMAPYAAAYFWKKANTPGCLASFFGGFAVWIVAYFIHLPYTSAANTDVVPGVEGVYWDWAMWDSLYIASVWGFIASVVLLIVVSLATQKKSAPLALRDVDGNIMATKGWFLFSKKGKAL
ncbi:MAG: sodium:solute symporter family protein [Spirochaetales bacterium]|nr:sodium:solute symporter family protein [Spirochaetales bacterium]